MRFPHALLAAAALLLGATSAQALLIDDFSVDQTSFIPPGAPAAISFFGAVPAGVGNSREVTLNRTAGLGTVEFGADNGIGNIGFAPNSSGTATLNWDGVTDGSNAASGLGADFTDGGGSSALRIVLRSDISGPLTIQVSSGIGNYSTASIATPGLGLGAGFTTIVIPFASFAPTGSGANFANVGAIRVDIGSAFIGHDVQIDVIDTTVPEPTTALLFGLGLAATAGVARRRAS
jgi:PEP-CTERM motif